MRRKSVVSKHLGVAVMVGLADCAQLNLIVLSLLSGEQFSDIPVHVLFGSGLKHRERWWVRPRLEIATWVTRPFYNISLRLLIEFHSHRYQKIFPVDTTCLANIDYNRAVSVQLDWPSD